MQQPSHNQDPSEAVHRLSDLADMPHKVMHRRQEDFTYTQRPCSLFFEMYTPHNNNTFAKPFTLYY